MSLAHESHQRGLKDFLTLYNTITEFCFNKCVSRFNERSPTGSEDACVAVCTDNYVQFNQRFMYNFVDHQERRKRDLENTAIIEAKKAEEAEMKKLQEATTSPESADLASSSSVSGENVSPSTTVSSSTVTTEADSTAPQSSNQMQENS